MVQQHKMREGALPMLPSAPVLIILIAYLCPVWSAELGDEEKKIVEFKQKQIEGASCCYGQKNYDHGEVVQTLPLSCLQLWCDHGNIMERYFNQPGHSGCCEFDGKLYPEGSHLPSVCITLVCVRGQWTCRGPIDDCCAQCSVYDGIHIQTFDQHRYDFHGTCNYSLAQSDSSYDPPVGVFSHFAPCYGSSCIHQTIFRDNPNTLIRIYADAVFSVEVNGEVVEVGVGGVQHITAQGVVHPVLAVRVGSCVVLVGSSRITVRHCRHRVDVLAHPAHSDGLDGLCGRYNTYIIDDFTDRAGQAHELVSQPLAFPNYWRTDDQEDQRCLSECPEMEGAECPEEEAEDACQARAKGSYKWKQYLAICGKNLAATVKGEKELWPYVETCAHDLCLLRQIGAGEVMERRLMQAVRDLTFEAKVILLARRGILTEWNCGGDNTTTTCTTPSTPTSSTSSSTSTTTSSTSTSTSSIPPTTAVPPCFTWDECRLYNDPHLYTFDKYRYDFHGTCNYSLAQNDSSYNPPIAVYADFKSCGRASCMHHTVFKDNPHTVIHINVLSLFNLMVNGELVQVTSSVPQQLETSGGPHPVTAYRTGSCVLLEGESGISVRHCSGNVHIFARSSFIGQLDGLCGHYNRNSTDDFTDRYGIVHHLTRLPFAYPVSWKTDNQLNEKCQMDECRGISTRRFGCAEEAPDPCKARQEKGALWRRYIATCDENLRRLNGMGNALGEYVETCAFDLCIISERGTEEEIREWLVMVCDITCEAWMVQQAQGGTLPDWNCTICTPTTTTTSFTTTTMLTTTPPTTTTTTTMQPTTTTTTNMPPTTTTTTTMQPTTTTTKNMAPTTTTTTNMQPTTTTTTNMPPTTATTTTMQPTTTTTTIMLPTTPATTTIPPPMSPRPKPDELLTTERL